MLRVKAFVSSRFVGQNIIRKGGNLAEMKKVIVSSGENRSLHHRVVKQPQAMDSKEQQFDAVTTFSTQESLQPVSNSTASGLYNSRRASKVQHFDI